MMSAFHPIATKQRTQLHVGFVPIADLGQIGTRARTRSDRMT